MSATRRHKAMTFVAVLATVLMGSACTSVKDGSEGEPALGPIPVITSYTQVVLPLDGYEQSNDQLQLDTYVSDRLVQRCMRRFGLDWTLRAPTPGSNKPRNDRRYGIIDAAQAAQYGYSAPESAQHKATGPSVTNDQDAVLVGRGQRTFNGVPVPDGGCAGEAQRVLAAGVPPLDTAGRPGLVQQLNHDVGVRADSDSRVRAAFGAWSRCMKESGYDYAGPWDANDDPHWSGLAVKPEEIATAVADVKCRNRTNLVGIWFAVEIAYQKRAIEANAQQLAEYRRHMDNLARNVARILAETATAHGPTG
jgi:hypothetical protein